MSGKLQVLAIRPVIGVWVCLCSLFIAAIFDHIIASAGPVIANVCGSLVLLFIALNPLVFNNNYTID